MHRCQALRYIGLVALSLSLCGLGAPARAQDKAVTIRVASAFELSTDMMQAAKRFADLAKERSGGTIDVRLFAGGQMGGEKDIVEALKIGEVEMGVLGTYPIVSLTPKYSFFDAPFVFRDKAHVYAAWNGKLGQEVREIFAKQHGIRAIGLMGRGYRHITSNTPINSVDDLKGVKIRMGQSKPFIDAFTATGAVVVPIALPELFTSLKLGVVSASDGPFDQIASFKLNEAQKYIAVTGHLYATSMWLMNETFYQGLSAKQKGVVDAALKEALAYGDELSAASEKALGDKLQQAGMQFTKPDVAPFMARAKPAVDKLFAELWSVTNADEIAKIQ